MRLLTQLSAIICLVILLGVTGGALTQRFVIWPDTKALTDQLDRKELEQVLLGFDVLRTHMLAMSRDYAYWTATYNFFLQPDNKTYLTDNLPLDTFVQNDFHFVVFKGADNAFQKVYMTTPDQSEFLAEAVLPAAEFIPIMPDSANARAGAPLETSGFFRTSAGPIVFAAATVMQNDLSGKSPGVILFGRFMDQDAIDDVRETVKKNFEVQALAAGQSVFDYRKVTRNDENQFVADLLDVNDKPLLRIAIALPPYSMNPWWNMTGTVTVAVLFLCTIIAIGLIYRSLVLPIRAISDYLKSVEEHGDYSARLSIDSNNELGVLANRCNSLLANIDNQHHRLEEQAVELRRLSLSDGLTQISNRRHFDEVLGTALAHAQRQKMPLTLIMCDVDHFKLFNDTYGHQGGDSALKALAEILMLARHRKTDVVARFGGEEFVMLLPDTDEDGARHVWHNIQKLLVKANIPHAASPVAAHLTVSMGIAVLPPPFVLTAADLIRRADEALYLAKKNGRNRAELWLGQG